MRKCVNKVLNVEKKCAAKKRMVIINVNKEEDQTDETKEERQETRTHTKKEETKVRMKFNVMRSSNIKNSEQM